MVQHVLLMLVAAPLIALAAPITLILRLVVARRPAGAGSCRSSTRARARARVPGHRLDDLRRASCGGPTSRPLFNAALEDPLVHDLEHGLFLTGALLFWWPAVGARSGPVADGPPGPDRLRLPADDPEHVPGGRHPQRRRPSCTRTTRRSADRGVDPLDDQRLAAGIMWIAGDAHLPDRDHGPGRRLDAGRGTRPGPGRPAGGRSTWPDPRPRAAAGRAAGRRARRTAPA